MFPRTEQILCRPRIAFFLCLSLLYKPVTVLSQAKPCIDSAGILKYSSASFTDESQVAFAAAAPLHDGGMVWWYGKTVTIGGNRSDSLLVFRTDDAGHLVWTRTIDETFPGYAYSWYDAGFLQMLEMQNGNLIFSADAGSTSISGGPMPDFTLLMLSSSGNRLWQHDYFGAAIGALAEGLNGEILSWSAGRLNRFDANGNILTQIQYQAAPGFSTTWPAIACTGNRIYLEGLYKLSSFGSGNEQGFYLIKTDYVTGKILDSRRYRLNPTQPSADTSDPARSSFTPVHQGAGFVFSTNIISPSASQFEVLLLSIDTMLNIVRPGLDMIKPVYARPAGAVFLAAICGINDAGIAACAFDDVFDRHLSYYAEVDEQGNFFSQRLLQFANPQYKLSVFPGNGNVLQQAMVSSQDQVIPYFMYADNSPELIGGPGCGGFDTSFITMHHIMPVANAITFTPNVLSSLTQSPVNTLSSATSIDPAPVCLQKSICDSIKINGPDSVCVGETGVRFTVTKNPHCLHYTTWSLDTSQVSIQSRPDDTTLILGFRESGRTWLSASPRGCGVEDSLQLTIQALRNVHLGRDRTLCPGDSLILDAGSGYLNYVWQDASTDSVYTVDKAGTYIVQVVDQCDHPSTDTVLVTSTNCLLHRLLVPGAFTPNGDGRNDLLRPIVVGDLVKYEFTVFNRWGQVVFRSFDPGAGWDGRIQGHIQAADAFVWICKYQFAGEELSRAKGEFLLIR